MAHTQPTQTQHRYQDREDTEDTDALRTTWLAEQARGRERIVEGDSCSGLAGDTWSYVGGLDISFIVGDDQGQTFTQIIVNIECPSKSNLCIDVMMFFCANLDGSVVKYDL